MTIEQPAPPQPAADLGLDEIFRRAEAALFDRGGGPQPSMPGSFGPSELAEAPVSRGPQSEEQSPTKGRILENLNEVDPLPVLLAERGETSRRGRKPGSKNKPKEAPPQPLDPASLANLKGRLELTPERINEALKAMERVASAASARGAKPTTMLRPRPDLPEIEEIEEIEAEEEAEATVAAEPSCEPAAPLAAADEPPSSEGKPRERVSVRRRYGASQELKPGERWKRRLRSTR